MSDTGIEGTGIELTGIDGANPLGFLAALGTLGALDRVLGSEVRMHWTDAVVSRPVISGVSSIREIVDAVMSDRDGWIGVAALDWNERVDIKFSADELRRYVAACHDATDDGRSAALAAGLVAEGSYDGNGASKPSDLHFTAGQQKFLVMARELRDHLSVDDVREAVEGPWSFDSKLPSLGWDISDDRVYALGPSDPSKSKKLSVPGAEWLGLIGLVSVPVAQAPSGTSTTGASGTWKRGSWSWSLWNRPANLRAVSALAFQYRTSDGRSQTLPASTVRSIGTDIRRTEQGGYGSFGPPTVTQAG